MDIIIANVLFWPVWYLISSIPYAVNQYIIDNQETIKILRINT